jgi:transposase
MRFYTTPHQFDGGIDLHARSLYVCLVSHAGAILLHRNMHAAPEPFLKAIAPYREGLVVAVECMLTWDGRADLCAHEGVAFVLGQALYMPAIPGGKATHDPSDAHQIAVWRRGGLLPQAYVYPAQMRATRDLRRRRTHLRRKRAELSAPVQNTTSHDNLPEIGKQLAYQANRDGVTERCADPAVQKSIAGALALLTHDDQRLTDLELSIIKAAKHHDANPLYLLQTVPGIGKILRRVRLDAIHDLDRFPRGQDFVSSGRLVKRAKASAGKRPGTSGNNIGKAHLKGAFPEAAALCLRQHPAGQKRLARWEPKQGTGKARTMLAPKLARAVDYRLTHPPAFELAQFLPGYGSRAGEPDASLDTHGSSLNGACAQSCSPASVNAEVRLGRLPQSLGPLLGHPLWRLHQERESRSGDVCCSSPAPDANWPAEDAAPPLCIGRQEGTT